MKPFTYDALAGRTVFAVGALGQVGDELARLGSQRVFLIVDSQAKEFGDVLAESLGSVVVARWHEVTQHVPFELAERARAAVSDAGADTVVCLGGGSSTGLAKAIALTHDLPILAVPTTYAGSEQTPIYGLTDARHKQTGRALKVVPKVVVYDPALDGRPASAGDRPERLQRTRALRRSALCDGVQSRHERDGARGRARDPGVAPPRDVGAR